MKYIKSFEGNFNHNTIATYFFDESDINKQIVNFIKKYNLEYVDNIKIYNHVYYIKLGKVGQFDDILLKCEHLEDEPEDIMIGIPRNKGVDIYKSILNQINKLTEDDIELLKTKQDSKKYNL